MPSSSTAQPGSRVADEKSGNRYPMQTSVEDSSHVYWTWYPNPFSPPIITDTTMGVVNSGLTFYCDLSDTVTVALLGESDSVLYAAESISKRYPHFSLAFCYAGARFPAAKLPQRYFKSRSTEQYRLSLSVRGRVKCIRRVGVYVPEGWYCWLSAPHTNK
jgi:hypothetical protein